MNNILTVLGEASIDVAGFANSGTITITDSLNLTANTFANSGGVVADAFTLSVAGDFDYDEGTITANTSNLTVGGDFSYDDSANDFVLGEQVIHLQFQATLILLQLILLIAELSLLLIAEILPLILLPILGRLVQLL